MTGKKNWYFFEETIPQKIAIDIDNLCGCTGESGVLLAFLKEGRDLEQWCVLVAELYENAHKIEIRFWDKI